MYGVSLLLALIALGGPKQAAPLKGLTNVCAPFYKVAPVSVLIAVGKAEKDGGFTYDEAMRERMNRCWLICVTESPRQPYKNKDLPPAVDIKRFSECLACGVAVTDHVYGR